MSLQHIILGLLKVDGEQSGYDIKASVDNSTRNFWYCDYSQIYRALSAIEEQGWVIATPDPSNKRNRKTYGITQEGDRAFLAWLAEDFEMHATRKSDLARTFFGMFADRERLHEQLLTYRSHIHERAMAFGAIKQHIIAECQDTPDYIPYWLMTIDQGMRVTQAMLEWCDASLATLDALDPSL